MASGSVRVTIDASPFLAAAKRFIHMTRATLAEDMDRISISVIERVVDSSRWPARYANAQQIFEYHAYSDYVNPPAYEGLPSVFFKEIGVTAELDRLMPMQGKEYAGIGWWRIYEYGGRGSDKYSFHPMGEGGSGGGMIPIEHPQLSENASYADAMNALDFGRSKTTKFPPTKAISMYYYGWKESLDGIKLEMDKALTKHLSSCFAGAK